MSTARLTLCYYRGMRAYPWKCLSSRNEVYLGVSLGLSGWNDTQSSIPLLRAPQRLSGSVRVPKVHIAVTILMRRHNNG